MSRAAVFDAVGTLLDLDPVRRAFPGPLEVWFERILHTGAALTLVGDFKPFAELAESTLPATLAQLGHDPVDRAPLDALKSELAPQPDAADALDVLNDLDVFIVTNGSVSSTKDALARGGLEDRIAAIVSIDDVQAFKPHRAAYAELERVAGRRAEELWLIAAHAWDVHAARTYGWNAVWVDRLEHEWPLPQPEPEHRAPDLVAAACIVVGA